MNREPLVEDIQDYALNIVDTVREPLLILDTTLRVRSANRAFYQTFQVSPQETVDRLIYELGNGQWDIPDLRTLLEDVVPKSSVFNDFELEHTFPIIGRRVMLLNARKLRPGSHAELLVLAMEDVTERRRSEADLKAIETYAQNIVDTVREPLLILDATLRVRSANRAFYQTFHVSPGETEGRLIYELGNGQWDIPDLRTLLEDIVPKSSVFDDFELEHAFPAIGRRVMLLNARKLKAGHHGELLVLAMEDVTARKRAEEALLEAGALQSAIFNSANFSSIATDEKGVIQIFNVGAERMLGYTAAEVVNKNTPADISDPQEVISRAKALSAELATTITPGFEALVFKASRGIEDIYELTYICKDGSRFPAIVSITALRDDYGRIIGYLLIGTDNSVRKQVELALHDAMAVAEKANLAKSDFLSSMSHELRTPLSAVLGFAQLMESGSPPPTVSQKRSIDQILQAGWYLLQLINEILDLAQIESGKLALSLEPTSLAEVMLECQAMIEPQGQKRGLRMIFGGCTAPHYVDADRTRLKQVLINLLSNAI